MTSVSVVVPCFNARLWIGATLDSAVQQDIDDLEIIVVDDGSTDGSGDFVARKFPDVRLVRTDNAGPSAARNLGTRLAHGDFVQYLDADDVLAPGKLRAQLQSLADSAADVAYGDWCELRTLSNGRCEVGGRVERCIEGDPQIALFTDFWCPPAVYLFRRAIVERVGAWNESLPIIQDARFVLDCALRGGEFVYCPGVMAYYRVHGGGSVSTRDRSAFTRDCFHNARSVEEWWLQDGALTRARKRAVLKVYSQVARASFVHDDALFEAACAAIERLQPGYVPEHPWHLSVVARLVGYRRAEAIALRYRRAKTLVSDRNGSTRRHD